MPKLCSFGCAPSGSSMHRFPNAFKFPECFKAWVTLVGGKLESASDYEFYQKKLICDIHFTPEDRVRNNRLKAYAIPSLYLHETLAKVSDIGCSQPSTSHASNTGPSASFMLEQEPPLIVAHSALSHTSTLTPAVTGTVRGIAPAVIMEHNYSVASRSTRKTFAKGSVRTLTYNYVQIKPLATKIRYLQSEISRLKKRGQSFKARLANAAKLSKETAFQQVVKNMRKPAQLFVHMQMQCLKKSKELIMNPTKKTTATKKVKEKSQDDLRPQKKDEKLKKSIYSVTTPRSFGQKVLTADIYSRQNSALKTPKKSLQTSSRTNASPMTDILKSSPSLTQLKSKKLAPNYSSKTKMDSARSTVTKTPRSANTLPFSNITVNSPITKRKVSTDSEIKSNHQSTPKTSKEVAKKEVEYNMKVLKNEVPIKPVERQRTHTRTLEDDEVKILTPKIVDNNAEMLNLSKKLIAQPKAFYVDINGEQSKPKKENSSEEDISYEDDFESYESDFDSYHSSGQSADELEKLEQEKENNTQLKEESMLDSGAFDLRDRSATKSKPMDFILEDADKKASLTDEGFQDMSSSSTVSSMRTVHVDVLERPLFIDFTKSKENRRKRRIFAKLKQRAKDILGMVTLHEMSFTLFEMKPIPYDLYMATFGRTNYTQVAVQTFDDGITVEVQTEEVECENRWTQHPIRFSNNTDHVNKKVNKNKNSDEIATKINSLLNFDNRIIDTNIDDNYEINPLRIYLEQKDGAGNDKMLPYDTYLSKTKQTDFNVNKLRKFLKKAEGRISNILSRNAGNIVPSNFIATSKYPFSAGYVCISSKNLDNEKENILKGTKITGVVFSETKTNLIFTIHEKSKAMSEHKSLLSLWDLNVAILQPIKLLIASEMVEIGIFRGNTDGVFIAALKDGTVHLWDLSEEANWICKDTGNVKNENETTEDLKKSSTGNKLQASAFTSSASNMDVGYTLDSVVGLEFITGNTVTLENGNKVIGQICTLLKRGYLILYSIIQERHKNVFSDIGKAFWSKMKLENYQTINLSDYLVITNEIDSRHNLFNFSLNKAKKSLSNKRQERNLIRNISRPKSAMAFDTDRPKSAARVKNVLPQNSNWESGILCSALKIINVNSFDNYLIGKNCGEVLNCRRIGGTIKVDRFNITGDVSTITVLEKSPNNLPYFLAATSSGTIHLCSLVEARVLLTLDCRNTPTTMTEKCQADSKGRFMGSVAVKQINYDDKYMESRLAVTSVVWSHCDPFCIVVGTNGRIDVWKLSHSDIHPYKVYEKAASKCAARDRNMALLNMEGDVELHKISAPNEKNLEVFQKYVSLL